MKAPDTIAATGYAQLAADGPDGVSVLVGSEPHPFVIVVNTWPLASHVYLDRPATSVTMAGLMELLTLDDPAAAGELLDRLVEIVAAQR